MATHAHGGLSVKHLYAPETVRIIVGPNKRAFTVPRALICAKSDYFNKAFQQHFEEGKQGVIPLVDVKEWVFECFVGWLYTERIFWEPINELDDAGPTPSSVSDPGSNNKQNGHEGDRHNPISWDYCYLIALYIFADKYDSRGFRNDTIMAFQQKSLQMLPRSYNWPHDGQSRNVFEALPESATLYRFVLDAHVFSIPPDSLSNGGHFVKFPSQTLAVMAKKAMQLARCKECGKCQAKEACDEGSHRDVKCCKPDYYVDICSYHEHESEEERKSCKKRWAGLNEEHNFDLGH
ncbi:hypothetical protein AC578_7169 [Pseudocercospora eumusae]|uniref:BTB domain-containing protein n=1 Tax=Pseudocercospora eumusae TaxID=321146 RepID=A0A139HWQ9_9PEZI|nr:hypothetical protein AC578_7169 [Pseudocercospora eumusae]